MATATPGASLRRAALRWLAQREHSRAELRQRLLRHRPRVRESADSRLSEEPVAPGALAEAVDAVLDGLVSAGFLSDDRFVESRVHARAAHWGQRRIQHELQQHGLALDATTADALRQSEFKRALALWQRRFDVAATDPKETLRQMRFLAGRGFSTDVIRRVVSGAHAVDPD